MGTRNSREADEQADTIISAMIGTVIRHSRYSCSRELGYHRFSDGCGSRGDWVMLWCSAD